MPQVPATPLAAIAYLVASGATRAEAEEVLTRIATKPVPEDLTATLDTLDTELVALREERRGYGQ